MFFKNKISYCGFVTDKQGRHKSQEKTEAVLKVPKSENVSGKLLPQVPNLASVLYPLLQRGTKWSWTENCETTFAETQRLITSNELLTHYDPSWPMRLMLCVPRLALVPPCHIKWMTDLSLQLPFLQGH